VQYIEFTASFFQEIIEIEETPKPIRKTATTRRGSKWQTVDLPLGCVEDGLWRKTFIPTYIAFISQQEDPWTITDAVAKSAMQKIWDKIFGEDIPHKITTDGAVFSVVSCILLSVKLKSATCMCLQAQQRVSDAWRSVIGSTGLAMVNAFFESNDDLVTDEARQHAAQGGLENLKFLYSDTSSGNPLVSLTFSSGLH
jgi:hypothetical protein